MNLLVTGGAGFIGSNLVRSLVGEGDQVRVLDDLSTGHKLNLADLQGEVELTVGDVRDADMVAKAVAGCDVVFHLAALPSVGRSIEDPFTSHDVNVNGTVTMLMAARDAGVRRLVFASSSSVYGETPTLPKREDAPMLSLSPYAASKVAGESYCRAFSKSMGLETVSLRPFNVFGPRQDPDSPYAAVIPLFLRRMLAGDRPVIYGDGRQTRDFTFIANAVQAFVLAAEAGPEAVGETMNLGCGGRTSLLDLVDMLNQILGTEIQPDFSGPRPGDIRDSQASIEKAERLLGYRPLLSVHDGLRETVGWFTRQPDMTAAVAGRE